MGEAPIDKSAGGKTAAVAEVPPPVPRPEPCHKCGWHLRKSDCATIEDGIIHCICYNCGQEWVE